jgi:hypothetical protein
MTALTQQKARLLADCYPSQSGRGWFDREAFLRLTGDRGVQCRTRYAESFAVEQALLESESDYPVN